MTRLLEEAFERASELPQEEQDKFARGSCWPNWMPSGDGLNFSAVQNRRICWSASPMKRYRSTGQDERGPSNLVMAKLGVTPVSRM